MSSDNQLFQQLPSTTQLLEKKFIQRLITLYSRQTVLFAIQEYLDTLRTDIKKELLSTRRQTLPSHRAFLSRPSIDLEELRLTQVFVTYGAQPDRPDDLFFCGQDEPPR